MQSCYHKNGGKLQSTNAKSGDNEMMVFNLLLVTSTI